MTWDDILTCLLICVVAALAAKWLIMSAVDVRDRWRQTRTYSWPSDAAETDEDEDEDDDLGDVLDTIHCRVDDVGDRIDRLESRIVDLEAARAACRRAESGRAS